MSAYTTFNAIKKKEKKKGVEKGITQSFTAFVLKRNIVSKSSGQKTKSHTDTHAHRHKHTHTHKHTSVHNTKAFIRNVKREFNQKPQSGSMNLVTIYSFHTGQTYTGQTAVLILEHQRQYSTWRT